MVKLNEKFLIRKNKYNNFFLSRKKEDTDEQFLRRITHLQLQNHFIEYILPMEHCQNVRFLYLQQNLLKSIENMENFPNLTHLYLQRNFIIKIANLNELKKLKKIYLGRNEIQVLEGMENLKEIKEIHLESQDFCIGETMYFEPLTVNNLGMTLQVLNISNNYLTTIQGLKNLFSLIVLNASNNYLSDINEITDVISNWNYLRELNLIGNEVTEKKWYKDFIIYSSDTLEILDDRPIHPNTRIYVKNVIKLKRQFRTDQGKREKKSKKKTLKFVGDVAEENNFDFINPFFPQNPIFSYPPWKLRKNVNSGTSNTLLPRQYWKKGGLRQ